MKRLTSAGVAVVLAVGSALLSAQLGPEERANRVIVRIATPSTGGGVIFGRAGQTAFIATPRHVISPDGTWPPRGEVTVEFRAAPGELTRAAVEPNVSAQLDLAVLRVVAPRDGLNGIDFNILGSVDELTPGSQVYPIGHPLESNWRRPYQPVVLRGRTGSRLTFETVTSAARGLSGGGLFDSRWRLIGLIQQDVPPDTLALSMDTAIAQLRMWGYNVGLTRQGNDLPPPPENPKQGIDNVIFTAPQGWIQQPGPGGTLLLLSPRSFNARIVIRPGQPLTRRFEDMFDEDVRQLNPRSFTTQVRTIKTLEGYRARFVEGTVAVDMGGITNPQMQEIYFLFMAADPIDRYESFVYFNDRYSFEADRPAVNKFVESLDYKNAEEQRQRQPR